MSAMVQQTPKLRASEVWALYGGELEYCLGGEDGEEQEAEYFDQHPERGDGQASVPERHSPPAPSEDELVSRHPQGLACLSDQDYYSQLEALKRMHLQNIAELEVLYLNELTASKAKASQGTQVDDKDEINKSAQDESEPLPAGRETSAVSKQDLELEQKSVSETDTPGSQGTDGEQKKREEEKEETAERASKQSRADATNEAQSLKPQVHPEPSVVVPKATRAASRERSRAPSRRSSWTERSGRRASRPVTVPKPFQMMVREDDKKRRNVKTRSEVVLENTLLRRELEEMRECRRQFRATPAPPSRTRSLGRRGRTTSLDRASDSSGGGGGSSRGGSRSRNTSPQPFSFIERERKKRERKLEEALRSGVGSRDQRWVFKARPLPRIYRASSEDCQLFGAVEMHSRDQEQQQQQQQQQHRGPPASRGLHKHAGRVLERERGGMEVDVNTKTSEEKLEGRVDQDECVDGPERPILDNANWTLRRKPSLVAKGLLLEGETGGGVRRGREKEWSYIQPIQRTCISLNLASSFSVSHERMLAGKSNYISV